MSLTKIINKNRDFIILLLIIIFASVLRLTFLQFFPPSLNWDEVSHGYNAYSILKTGKDEWGQFMPIIFRAYGDYKLPVYIYLVSISEFLFGLSSFAVRFPSALAGIITVLFTYLLVKKFLDKNIGFVAAFLVAIEPWSLFVSRIAVEANVAVALILAGVYFLITGLEEKTKNIFVGFILLGLSVWTYNSARVFVPLLLISIIFIYRSQVYKFAKGKRSLITSVLLLAVFFIPMIWQFASGVGGARYEWLKILDEGSIAKIEEMRNMSTFTPIVTKIVFNKYTFFASSVIENYLAHFSPNFLFLNGGTHYQFSLPNHGLLYLINFPFFIFGIAYVLKNFRKNKFLLLVLVWSLLGPIASSITKDSPHALRSLVILPTPMILTAIGLVTFFNKIAQNRKKLAIILIALYIFVIGSRFENYIERLFNDYRVNYSWAWQFGYKEVADYVENNKTNYDKIIITKKYGEPHEFLLFYNKINPDIYRNDPYLIRFPQTNWFWVDRFDKYYFVNDWEIPHDKNVFTLESKKEKVDCSKIRCLLITSPGNAPKSWSKMADIKFLDNKTAFEIYANK